jgi:hypothetical protein
LHRLQRLVVALDVAVGEPPNGLNIDLQKRRDCIWMPTQKRRVHRNDAALAERVEVVDQDLAAHAHGRSCRSRAQLAAAEHYYSSVADVTRFAEPDPAYLATLEEMWSN